MQTQKRKFVILTRLRLNSSFNNNTINEKIFITSSEMTKKTKKIRKEKIFHSALNENSKKTNRSLSLSSTLSTFDKLHRITRLKNVIDLSIAKWRNVMYSSLSKSKRTSSLLKRSQNQTIRNNSNVKFQLKTNLNYNFENFDEKEKKNHKHFFSSTCWTHFLLNVSEKTSVFNLINASWSIERKTKTIHIAACWKITRKFSSKNSTSLIWRTFFI